MRIGRKKVRLTHAKASAGNKSGKETPGSPPLVLKGWAKSLGTSQPGIGSPTGVPATGSCAEEQAPVTGSFS